jgi:hypothetical protein
MIKKFLTLAVVAALFVACGEKPEPEPTPNPGPGTETPEEPEEPEEPAFEGLVKIDGNFEDWAALTEDQYVVSTLPTEGTIQYPVIKTFKMHADEMYIYIYVDFDARGYYNATDDAWTPANKFDIFMDEDNNPETGRLYGWSSCSNIMMQGTFDGTNTPYDPSVSLYTGADMDSVWEWEDLGLFGFMTAVLPVEIGENLKAFECSLLRPMLGFEMAETIGVGVLVETADWKHIGHLPQNSMEQIEADGGVNAPMLYITLPAMAEE